MVPAAMRFDKGTLDVKPGEKVKLVLKNPDDLEHNWVLLDIDKLDPNGLKFAEKCMGLGVKGPEMAWTIDSPRVLQKSGMLSPHQDKVIYFVAPEKKADFTYLCSFPGHANLMRGTLKCGTRKSPFTDLSYSIYEGDFKRLPKAANLKPVSKGKATLVDPSKILDKKKTQAIVWEGTFTLEKGGQWEFFLGSDDGSRLAINGENVINNDGVHPFKVKKAKEKLGRGVHTLKLEYFNRGPESKLSLVALKKGEEPMVFTEDRGATKGAKSAPAPPIYITPENGNAIVFRTFLQGRSARSIAVGYSEDVALSWNADTLNLDMLWRGGFLNAGPNWHNRGSSAKISGRDMVMPTGGMALQVLSSQDQAWIDYPGKMVTYERDKKLEDSEGQVPMAFRGNEYKYVGYDLDEKGRPTFSYSFHKMKVTDRFVPKTFEGGKIGIERTLKFEGKAPEKTHFLAGIKGTYEAVEKGWLDAGENLLVKVSEKPLIRTAEARNTSPLIKKATLTSETRSELLVPIKGDQTLKIMYTWKTSEVAKNKK